MTMDAARDLSALMRSVFIRKGANGKHIRTFDLLSQSVQRDLIEIATPANNELLVIGGMSETGKCLLLTTKNILSRTDGELITAQLREVSDAIIDLGSVLGGDKSKVDTITVIDIWKKKYNIWSEPGPPLSGVWNVLKIVGQKNQHLRPDTPL